MQRQKFHITAEQGWINDPNGLVFFKGYYHAFFQYHPYSTEWGPMHWGHVRSADLVRWEHLPPALAPTDDIDKDGCFSGSALVADGRLYLMYTGVVNRDGKSYQSQCLAYSEDGLTFRKYPEIVIGRELLPEGFSPFDFRDPCLFEKNGKFYALVASKKGESSDILLFSSENLTEWKCVGPVLDRPSSGSMIECPCWNEECGFMIYSDQFSVPEACEHLNLHSNFYRAGKLDCAEGRFQTASVGIMDYGFDFYAAQFFACAEKPLMLAWMQMWDRNIPSRRYGFAGMLTLPRYVENRDGRFYQTPVPLDAFVARREVFEKENFDGRIETSAEIYQLRFSGRDVRRFSLALKKGAGEQTRLYTENGYLVFDRSESGEKIVGAEKDALSLSQIRKMPLSDGGSFELTVVADRFSVEIFSDGRSMTNTVYPKETSNGIQLDIAARAFTMEIGEISL